jgi:uncharacterized protein YdeI (BOF family)
MKIQTCLASAVVLAALASIPASAQSQDSQQQPTQAQPSQPQGGTADSSAQAQSFNGTIVKTKSGYALNDESNKSAYMLDDQTQAKKFSGKSVKVTGTLDTSTNTIHVSNIELVSNSY